MNESNVHGSCLCGAVTFEVSPPFQRMIHYHCSRCRKGTGTGHATNLITNPAVVFQHLEAHARFGASVFWTRRSGALGGEQAMIEYWQVRREGGQRGVVEILPEGT
jgi:hypothetical protein